MSRFAMRILLPFLPALGALAAGQPLLLQKPTVNKTHIVFSYAGDLWSVPREGGEAVRLTAGPGVETDPVFSPDGLLIAFQGEYEGNQDVYVVPATGGLPKRLTYHPAADTPVGWSPDGKQILFRSNRDAYSRFTRLFTISVDGGFPAPVDLPMAYDGAFAEDGSRLAYMPITPAFQAWKRYRGGQTTPIWLANLSDAKVEKIPRDNSNDFNPIWIGGKVYFLSDRAGPVSLFSYDTATKKVAALVANDGFDIKSASAGGGAIVYEQFGSIHLFDLKSGKSKKIEISVSGDIPSLRPAFEKLASKITQAGLSPTGARAVFEARGDIFTVPAEKGDVRNITNTAGVAERYPAWSPDGKQIAYFSDESGEYELHLRAQNGLGQDGSGDVKKIGLGTPPAFYYDPMWSPDGKKIAYQDSLRQLWYLDLESKQPVRIDGDTYFTPERGLNPDWSPDSKWIAYTKNIKNHLRAVFLYSLDDGQPHQASDGMSDAEFARFDKNGKYLYFTASTNTGLTTAWLDMSGDGRNTSSNVYVAVLRKEDPSPLAPESDEEKAPDAVPGAPPGPGAAPDATPGAGPGAPPDATPGATQAATSGTGSGTAPGAAKDPSTKSAPGADKKQPEVRIDLPGLDQRILALPIPPRDYMSLDAGKTGILFLNERVENPAAPPEERETSTLYKFDLKTRKTDKVMENLKRFAVSQDGEKMLYRQGANWTISAAGTPAKLGEGALKLDGMEARIDPRAEWKQMYHEVWRIERDFFYDPALHGLDWKKSDQKYEPYLETVASRGDLNYLFEEMLGEITVGHLFVRGGAFPEIKRLKGGLLGADYKIENGRYRFAKVYSGENWNPQLKAPLTQPGVGVTGGEYLLAVNGRDVRPPANIYSFFEETAGKSVVLRVGPNADGSGSREVTVVPIENEGALRNLAWIEENRRKVDQLSRGRLAYVYLPNTGEGGFTNFNRYYFAQIGKEGAVIDERFNGGGQIADYIIDNLNRPLTNFFMSRAGQPTTTPQEAIFGPKAMIVNEYAGSGGDAMPWLFRQRGIGPLIGKRTWGGLVGIAGFPPLIDGGTVTAPDLAFYNLKGEWEIENHGVAPDIEVENDPALVRAGHDPQLEKAVQVVMAELEKHPAPQYRQPPFPNYHKTTPVSSATSSR
jgi:tricorn protease